MTNTTTKGNDNITPRQKQQQQRSKTITKAVMTTKEPGYDQDNKNGPNTHIDSSKYSTAQNQQ